MPIYEYLCRSCKKRSSILVLSISNPAPASCHHCGGTEMERLLSRFASPKSEEARLESMTDLDSLGDLDDQDPASAARMIKKMSAEMGEEVGDEMEAMMDQAGTDGDIMGGTDSL
jgi:putative FmdB family regulatory protein